MQSDTECRIMEIAELIAKWDSNEGKPYKGKLIDLKAYKASPDTISCFCAQGQVLHLLGGWSPKRLGDTEQKKADRAVAKLLNISVAHSILLRRINDNVDGAPSIVLTHPEKVLGDQAKVVLAFWLHLDRMKAKDWRKVVDAWDGAWGAAWDAARGAAWDGARGAAWDAARGAARDAARGAARDAAWGAAGDAAWGAAGAAAGATSEIQGAAIMRKRGKPFFFLPLFGFADPEAIPALPADYGIAA